MIFDVLTLFPEMFEPLKQSIIKRATESEIININLVNIRDFSENRHKTFDNPFPFLYYISVALWAYWVETGSY